MSYKSKATWWSETDEKFDVGTDTWTGQELDGAMEDLKDSVQWNDAEASLTDGATITWDYNTGGEKTVTLGGNRTLSITNLPTDRVVYGTLRVVQDGTGGRALTLPSPSGTTTVGSLNTASGGESYITFRYNGSKFRFNIS
jgi:hypothetical protein